MEVTKGYKQGAIQELLSPKEGWVEKILGNTAVLKARIGWQGLTTAEYIDSGDFYLVTGTDFKGGYIDWNNCHYVDESRYKQDKNIQLRKHDVLVTKDGTIGKVALVNHLDKPATLNSGVFVIRPVEDAFHPEFFYHLLCSNVFTEFLGQLSAGSTINHLYQKDFVNFIYKTPATLPEQTAIADALSDADALIQSLEKLIAKKRNIKQGAMQELLKPKEGWVVKKLGEVAVLKARIGWQGLTTAEYKEAGDYYLITGTDFKNGLIDWENCVYVESQRYQQDKNIHVKEHDVLVTKDGTIGKVAFIKDVPKPATLNSGVFVIRPIEQSFHPEFFYYLLLSEHFLKFLSQLSAGSTINHLYQKDFVHFEFQAPITNQEQTRIAIILSDMDAEISALETKLSKYKQIKQGMMQELLTGRIRLVETSQERQKVVPIDKNISKKKHNWQINEAVVIAVLTKEVGSDEFPLGRKRYTKLSYLLHRHMEQEAKGYSKKAAGPYNPATKYGGPERIALGNKYIKQSASGQYSGFVIGENIAQAVEYFNKWYGQDALKWLSQFKYEKTDTLELWTTIDMAVQDLKRTGKKVSTEAVKELINHTEEWKPKLLRSIFSNENIGSAILKTNELFNG
jgi:type I restriction enzyme S subunit